MKLLAGKTVFMVEDDSSNLSISASLLREGGATVIFDVSGLNTIEQIQQFPQIDIILLDLNLRDGVSGFDLHERIKAQPELAHIPVVAVSAIDPSIGMAEARQRGFDGFISKPVDFSLFASQIASIVGGEQVWFAA